MKAAVFSKYGPPEVLTVKEVPRPIPNKNEILIKVKASAVNAGDWRLRKADPPIMRLFFGLLKPRRKILGTTVSGIIEETGEGVKQFKPGDEVFGSTGFKFGGHAEYCCLPARYPLLIKPPEISHETAAAIPFGGITALYYLKKAGIKHGDSILIYGASGATGTAAVQLAVHFGAIVTGVCSGANEKLVRSLGAEDVIDYKKEDFSAGEKKYDVIFDAVGKTNYSACKKILKDNGKFLTVNKGLARTKTTDLEFLTKLALQGKLNPVIEKVYPLENIADAHRHAESGHKKGNIVIAI